MKKAPKMVTFGWNVWSGKERSFRTHINP